MFQRYRNLTASLLISCTSLVSTSVSVHHASSHASAPVLEADLGCCLSTLNEGHLGKVFRAIYESNVSQSADRGKSIQEWLDKGAKPKEHPLTPEDEDLEFVSLAEAFGLDTLSRVYTSNEPPSSEKSFLTNQATKVLAWFVSKFQPDDGSPTYLSGSVEEIQEIIRQCYSRDGKLLLDMPQYPFSIAETVDVVAESAVSGPFARYLSVVDTSEASAIKSDPLAPAAVSSAGTLYSMGLPEYAAYTVKPGLMDLGGRAFLRKVGDKFQTLAIQYQDVWNTPDAESCKQMQDVVMATLSTDLTVRQHYENTHVLLAGTFCTATHRLPKEHPFRALLHPYTLDTMGINNYNSRILLRENAMFHSMFSFPHSELIKVLKDGAENFDLRMADPNERLAKAGSPLATTEVRIWGELQEHVQAYVDAVYKSDEALMADESMVRWYRDLRDHMPNQQIEEYTGKLTKETLTKLVTLFMFVTTVEHHLVGTMTFNYLPWMNKIPSAVRADGRPATQELVILAAFLLLVTQPTAEATVVEHSFTKLIPDEKLRGVAEALQKSLGEIQAELDQSPLPVSAVQPKNLKLSVNS